LAIRNKNTAVGFNLAHPNWQENKQVVNLLEQDTIAARAKGKFRPSWHEVSIPEWMTLVLGSAIAIATPIMFLKKQLDFKSLSKIQKVAITIAAPLGLYLASDSASYIFTGKRIGKFVKDLFSKKDGGKTQ